MIRPRLQAVILVSAALLCGRAALGDDAPALKDVFGGCFRVGVAVAQRDLEEPDERVVSLITKQFNSLTSENLLKWEVVHPEPERYDFAPADRFVEFGQEHGMFLVGHTLIWHNQTPRWVFEDASGNPLTREALLERMREHIHAVVGRYRGRIHGWDVVNEAIDDDGSLRDTPWRRIIGDDYLEYAYRFAREADPKAELYYNDYNVHHAAKRGGVVKLIARLKEAGCRVDAVGIQAHWALDYPTEAEAEQTIAELAACTGRVAITELDVNVLPRPGNAQGADLGLRGKNSREMDPYREGLPDAVLSEQAERYAMFFRLFLTHSDAIDRVTFWGVDDGRSWHNGWPIRGRTAHSLLFDRSLDPKPAFDAIVESAAPPEEHNCP